MGVVISKLIWGERAPRIKSSQKQKEIGNAENKMAKIVFVGSEMTNKSSVFADMLIDTARKTSTNHWVDFMS